MNKNKCIIFAAGDYYGGFERDEGDFIIAADAGYHHLASRGISPDLLLGDFDTIGSIPENLERVTFPAEKDYTDTELAILEGIDRGFTSFTVCGALGGKRLEHTLGNLSLAAAYAKKGYDITLTDGDYTVKALHNSKLCFDKNEKGYVSVFSISGKAQGVSISGLKYTLSNATLDSSNPTLCISNEFTGNSAEISVSDGTVLIMWQKSKN